MTPHRTVLIGTLLALSAGCTTVMRVDPAETQARPQAAQAQPTQTAQATQPAPTVADLRELDAGPPRHVTFRPQEVDWQPGPASFEEGARFAVLEGDPSEPGVFTMQLLLPDGFVIRPHSHPNIERVTVLAGTFHLGDGAQVDPTTADALPTGSYTAMPKGMVHYGIAEGETILQLTTVGPWEIVYVDPADDPRLREAASLRD